MAAYLNIVHLTDCMDFMADKPDKYYDLGICDPPYGIGVTKMGLGKGGGLYREPRAYKQGTWDHKAPSLNYFDELFRISKKQIIWGANHFISKMSFDSSCWVVWDKDNGKTDFADCELAWTSFDSAVRIFKYKWCGMLQQNMKNKEKRIHPTQKPVALYKWLLQNYAKPGQTIFDSHVGSGSIRIACHDLGFDFEGCEIDKDYRQAQEDRYSIHIQQDDLFDKAEMQDLIYGNL